MFTTMFDSSELLSLLFLPSFVSGRSLTELFPNFSSVLHNPHLGLSSTLESLYICAKSMADCVVPQEYGTTFEEKRSVGAKISSALLEKIV